MCDTSCEYDQCGVARHCRATANTRATPGHVPCFHPNRCSARCSDCAGAASRRASRRGPAGSVYYGGNAGKLIGRLVGGLSLERRQRAPQACSAGRPTCWALRHATAPPLCCAALRCTVCRALGGGLRGVVRRPLPSHHSVFISGDLMARSIFAAPLPPPLRSPACRPAGLYRAVKMRLSAA